MMKRMPHRLNSLKSRYFMLLSCLTLLLATTSCNNDELEFNDPQSPKQYTKAELIEQALSRIPKTRASGARDIIATMVTIKDTITIKCSVNDTVTFCWDGRYVTQATEKKYGQQGYYIFDDLKPSHYITIIGTEQALLSLGVDNNGLIFLEINSNPDLTSFGCDKNHLDEIDLTGCPNLQILSVSDNDLLSLDVKGLSNLESFDASNNRLKNISFGQHPNMYELFVENNKLTDLDLSGMPDLYMLTAQNNPLKTMNLKESEWLGYLDISSTSITTLDLSHNMNLWELNLNSTSIKILNNQWISNTSFSVFKALENLHMANTSFLDSLDLASNPRLSTLDISGSEVTRLELGDNPILGWLYATRSELTDLIGEKKHLGNLVEVRIESTPLEKDFNKMRNLFTEFLPSRVGEYPGRLYTYSPFMNILFEQYAKPMNWEINK